MKISQRIVSISAEISGLLYTSSVHLSTRNSTDQLHYFANQLSMLDEHASQEARTIALLVEAFEALPGDEQPSQAFELFSSVNKRIERLKTIAGQYQCEGN